MHEKNYTYEQACEYDADKFAARQYSQECPICIKEIINFQPSYFISQKNTQGYFNNEDYHELIKSIKHPFFCSKYKDITPQIKAFCKEHSIPLFFAIIISSVISKNIYDFINNTKVIS